MKATQNIAILGAALNTGNLGVNALAISTIQLVAEKIPDARILLFGSTRERETYNIFIRGKATKIETFPVRLSFNPFISQHFLGFFLYGIARRSRILTRFTAFLASKNPSLHDFSRITMFLDITGGDSFSDIYGFKRFCLMYFIKKLAISQGKPFIMLPQTFGPFKSAITRILARNIINGSDSVFCRDAESLARATEMVSKKNSNAIHFCPDLAFSLEPTEYVSSAFASSENLPKDVPRPIGLNVSGLLYSGGYNRDNMFSLQVKYDQFIVELIDRLYELSGQRVLLIPHVISTLSDSVECDLQACRKILDSVPTLSDKTILIDDTMITESQVKNVISHTSFFVGSRMHSTIAALSQGIPAVGLAYSKKFSGVFATVGAEDLVLDLRTMNTNEILTGIEALYSRRAVYEERLRDNVVKAKDAIKSIPLEQFINTTD